MEGLENTLLRERSEGAICSTGADFPRHYESVRRSRESGQSDGTVPPLGAHCVLRDLTNFVCWGMYLLLLRSSGDCRSILVDVVAEEDCKHT